MKKHPVSLLCSLAMTIALAVLIVCGILLWKHDMLQALPGWGRIEAITNAVCVLAFAAIGAAAVASGICAAAHCERAMRAGPAFKRTAMIAGAYVAGCVVVDLLAAEVGLLILSGRPIVIADSWLWVITAAFVFVALARPAMAMILQGTEEIDKAAERAARAEDHAQTLEQLHARAELTQAQKGGNVVNLKSTTAVGLIGAAALLTSGGHTEAAFAEPAPVVETVQPTESVNERVQFAREEIFFDAAPVIKPGMRGPRASHRERFISALALVADGAGHMELHQRLKIDRKTAVKWHGWARDILHHPPNASLLDATAA